MMELTVYVLTVRDSADTEKKFCLKTLKQNRLEIRHLRHLRILQTHARAHIFTLLSFPPLSECVFDFALAFLNLSSISATAVLMWYQLNSPGFHSSSTLPSFSDKICFFTWCTHEQKPCGVALETVSAVIKACCRVGKWLYLSFFFLVFVASLH